MFTFFRKHKGKVTLLFALLFFVGAQYAVSQYVTLDTVYKHRIKYQVFQKDKRTLEAVVDQIARTIRKEKLEEYIILLGNSVTWGTNESSEHSLNRYLNELSTTDPTHKQTVFNLSLPSMQAGDAYTLLLMLDKKNISTDHVMVGLTYSAFIDRSEGPRAVFWTGDDLRELDNSSYRKVKMQLEKGYYKHKSGWDYVEFAFVEKALNQLPLYRYRTIVESNWELEKKGTDLLGNPKAWYEKKVDPEKLKTPDYLNFFNPAPFVKDERNWGVYFMNRIIEHQQDKRLLVFMAGGNSELSEKEMSQPGYKENLEWVEQYFATSGTDFLQLHNEIDAKLFTDHVHLTKEGNQQLAQLIWQKWQEGSK